MAEEQQSNPSERASDKQGRDAAKPHEIPASGWKSILKRTKDDLVRKHLSTVAAGVGLFWLIALVPTLGVLISIYGLIADPGQIEQQFASIRSILPAEVYQLLSSQMKTIASSDTAAGWGALVGIVLALWSGSIGIKALIDGLNVTYHEQEKRGFFKLTLTSLLMTLAGIVGVSIVIGLLAAVPALTNATGLSGPVRIVVETMRWVALFVFFLFALSAIYRYGPSRDEPKWKWVSWGAVAATALWLAISGLFTLYVAHFANYNKTYGSLGAIVILLMWLYLSAFAILLGSELNAEMELQTEKDTTRGPPEPRGQRGAYAADNLGESR